MSESNKKNQPPAIQKAVKHCTFCRLDITNLLHVQCIESTCRNFEQCLHCFSLGLELDSHLTSHRYKVISSTSIPVFSDDWGADQELALLDAVEKCGLGNWTDIAAYVGQKSEHVCESHYFNKYIFSPFSPLPDLTQPYPATTLQLLRSSHDHNVDPSQLSFFPHAEDKNGPYHATLNQPPHRRIKKPPGIAGNQQAAFDYEQWYRCRLRQAHFEKPQETSRWKLQQMEFKGQMKNNLSLAVGYLPQRHDYEIEYLNDAEKDIADMSFLPDDTTIERELKLRVMELYNHVLDERIERKEFIDRYQLLVKRDRKLTREEQQVYKSLRPFARYLEAEDFDELVRSIVVERSLRLRIEQLQTYRLNGLQTIQDGMHFDLDYHQIMNEWESLHKKTWLDATTIPVGQYEALKNVLKDLDKELDLQKNSDPGGDQNNNNNNDMGMGDKNGGSGNKNNNNNIDDIDSFDSALQLDPEGRPMVQFVNGYPSLSSALASGRNTSLNLDKKTRQASSQNGGGINPFRNNVVSKQDVPSFFSSSTNNKITGPFSANTPPSPQLNTAVPLPQQHQQSQEPFIKSIPITSQQSRATNCPCVATGGAAICIFNIKDYPHAQMLSQAEQLLCKELHLLPQHYLVIKDQLIKEAVQNGFITQGTARNVLKVDVHVTDRVLNFCISQNIIPAIVPGGL